MTDKYTAAYVRGLTFNGQKCLFVKTVSGVEPAIVLKDDKSTWKTDFDNFCKCGSYPSAVGFEGSDLVLGLGSSYDEAVRACGVSAKPGDVLSDSLDDVVRGKAALVTGAAQGFGLGMATSLVKKGAFVYLADMNYKGALDAADSLNACAGRTVAMAVEVNVCDESSVEAMMDTVGVNTGSVDLFVSNAGVLKAGSVKDLTLKDFEFVTNVDYKGFFVCSKFAARQMSAVHSSCGSYMSDIIVISSKSGLEGSNKNGAYAGAKFGVIGLAQSFALELVSDGIKVNAICPGNFLNGPLWSDPVRGLFVQYLNAGKVPGAKNVADVRKFYESKVPLGRGCETEDVMKAMFYIVEQKYETGQAVPVTGGQVMLN